MNSAFGLANSSLNHIPFVSHTFCHCREKEWMINQLNDLWVIFHSRELGPVGLTLFKSLLASEVGFITYPCGGGASLLNCCHHHFHIALFEIDVCDSLLKLLMNS